MESTRSDGGSPDGGRVWRGAVVEYEGEEFKVLRTREVDGFAVPRYCDYEVLLAPLDGGDGPGWVGENEVRLAPEACGAGPVKGTP